MTRQKQNPYGIVLHGGAGTILKERMTPELEAEIRATLTTSVKAGYDVLEGGGDALGAVTAAVNVMEDSPNFNAGRGAVFTHDGHHEQDATLIDGSSGEAGCIAGVRHVARPIDLARLVMEKSPHVLLIGEGAEKFAVEQGVKLVEREYFGTARRWQQLEEVQKRERETGVVGGGRLSEDDKSGTVGAVALDQRGNLAAATSSGGMTNKRWGRVGDSAIIGAGTWADERVAVSTTGHGEYFMRGVTAYDLAALMKYQDFGVAKAAETVIEKLGAKGGTGGLIALGRDGSFALPFNTTGMYRGYLFPGGEVTVDIFRD